MANPEHVAIVRQGKSAFEKWRESNPWERLDFREADLHQADLHQVDLHKADLSGADLRRVILSETKLNGAELRDAKLSFADLRGVDFTGADLTGADLRRVDLREADLRWADLRRANLGEADLSGADFHGTRLGATGASNIDLSAIKNLDYVVHYGPSSIDIDTLFRSRGKIPMAFLRGCGVPDILITFLSSLTSEGIEFYSAFTSYGHNDEEFANRLHARMQQEHLRVWYAPHDIKAGRKTHEQIYEAIRVHDKVLLVVSEHSMNSEWVLTEIRRARKREREEGRQVLFPIRLVDIKKIEEWAYFDADSGKDLAVEIREYHIPDFSNWKDHDAFEAVFANLLRDLQQPREIVTPFEWAGGCH